MAKKTHSQAPKCGFAAAAFTTAAFLSGAMMSLAAITVPVLIDTNIQSSGSLLRQWARLYHYGHIYMPTISVTATSIFAYTAWCKRKADSKQWRRYAMAGLTTISMVPFTWLIMDTTNTALFRLETSDTGVEKLDVAQDLIARWALLHAVRSVFPLAGAILGLGGMLQELDAHIL